MTAFHDNKLYWRIAILILCGIALIGPWQFETAMGPGMRVSPHECAPGFRLDQNLCGFPISGLWLILAGFAGLFHAGSGLLTGSMDFITGLPVLLTSLLLLLPLLPFPATYAIMWLQEGASRRGQLLQAAIWGAAAVGAGLFTLTTSGPGQALLWGLWFYLCLAFGMLLLELWVMAHNRRPAQAI